MVFVLASPAWPSELLLHPQPVPSEAAADRNSRLQSARKTVSAIASVTQFPLLLPLQQHGCRLSKQQMPGERSAAAVHPAVSCSVHQGFHTADHGKEEQTR